MDLSLRNSKVAKARWMKIRAIETAHIPNTDEALRWKAALCGFLAGDGSVKKREAGSFSHYDIKFYPDDGMMLSAYLYAIQLVYSKTPTITVEDNVFHARLASRTVYEDLTKSAEFGIHTWTVSRKLFHIPGAREAWLRAFFSAEAYVGPNSIKLQTVNKNGILEVSGLLTELGIDNRVYYYVPKNPKHSQVSIIHITKKEARRIFLDKIGFWHTKKTAALKKAL